MESGHDPPVIGSGRYKDLESGHDPIVNGSVIDAVIESGHDPPVTSSGMYDVCRANPKLIMNIFEVKSVLYFEMSCISTRNAYTLGNVCAWNVPPDLAAVLKIPLGRFLFICYVLVLFLLVYNRSSTEKNDVTVVIYIKKNNL